MIIVLQRIAVFFFFFYQLIVFVISAYRCLCSDVVLIFCLYLTATNTKKYCKCSQLRGTLKAFVCTPIQSAHPDGVFVF